MGFRDTLRSAFRDYRWLPLSTAPFGIFGLYEGYVTFFESNGNFKHVLNHFPIAFGSYGVFWAATMAQQELLGRKYRKKAG